MTHPQSYFSGLGHQPPTLGLSITVSCVLPTAEPQGVIPGIIGAVVVAVAGAISSFIAYQKKKLCFKGDAEQGDINMENHRSTNAEPQVQKTLLTK